MKTKMNIEFKQIQQYPAYEISRCGIIKNIKTKLVVKQKILRRREGDIGYYRVTLYDKKNKTHKNIVTHRLLMLTFVPNPNNYPQVNHIDGNKHNNNLDNLEWCTQSHNMKHAHATGLKKPLLGEKANSAKLKNIDIPIIRKMLMDKVSQLEIAEMYGVSRRAICYIKHGKNYSHIK